MWDELAQELCKPFQNPNSTEEDIKKYTRTGKQCVIKWNNLKQDYKVKRKVM